MASLPISPATGVWRGQPTTPAINTVRDRVKRAMLATVFFAHGTPMLLAGDEFGRTQHGNNNAYCQDNEMSWLDWEIAATPSGTALTAYIARLIALRREHAVLRSPMFMHGRAHPAPDIADIAWFDQGGGTIPVDAWNDLEQRTLVLRRAMQNREGKVTILTLLLNPTDQQLAFRLPEPHLPSHILLDSADAELQEHAIAGTELSVAAHSAMLLYAERAMETA